MRLSKGFTLGAFFFTAGAAALIAAQAPSPAPEASPPAQQTASQQAAAGAATTTEEPGQQAAGRGGRGGRGAPAGGGGFANAYPQHEQAPPEKIAAGKTLYDVNCSFCHGADARGGEGGPNLLHSEMVMDDQKGELITPVVQNGRPDTAMPKFNLTTDQISDVAAYIHSFRVAGYDLSRMVPTNIVVGNAQAGEAFFNGPGKCNTCHSVTGDLAGIGAKMEPKILQNAIVSGRAGRGGFGAPAEETPRTTITVTVTLTNGKTVEGKLDHLDDFTVSLTDANDNHLTYSRSTDVKSVAVHNPLQYHIDLLPKWTDDQIHDVTAYLVTLK
ncbi:MAG TPA: cytochrome c [Candidatus Acidoferrales bacterium]|nr:cytochrome c [Candidatus Acidoferrales bacterium]